jgi:hypothetical protein
MGKLEAEIWNVKSEKVAMKGQVMQLQGGLSHLKTENATMMGGRARITQIPALNADIAG